ncbi:hypothetical protein PCE1_000943 [Barthelona sp. PCE]
MSGLPELEQKSKGEPPMKVQRVTKEDSLDSKTEEGSSTGSSHSKGLKKVGFVLSFIGQDYHGSAVQKDVPTIEGEFFKALREIGVFYKDEVKPSHFRKFSRASRVDKGVNSVGFFVSMRCILPENPVELINEHLPDCIRLLRIMAVSKGLDSRRNADSRLYSYIVPCYILKRAPDEVLNYDGPGMSSDIWEQPKYVNFYEDTFTDEDFERLVRLSKTFPGNRNFWNFSSGMPYSDVKARRILMDFHPEKIITINDVRYVQMRIYGKSFVLAQIRKMMSMLIAMFRGIAPENVVQYCVDRYKMNIARAPGEFLCLDLVKFDEYVENVIAHGGGEREFAIYDDDFFAKQAEFKETVLLPHMAKVEADQEIMKNWVQNLDGRWFFTDCKTIDDTKNRMTEERKKRTITINMDDL